MASSPGRSVLSFLQDDIDVATAQLETLDENDGEYSVKKMVLEHGLASLKEQKEAAGRDQHASQPEDFESPNLPFVESQGAQAHNGIGSSNGFASYAGDSPSSFGSHSLFLRPNKRQRESFGSSGNFTKSRRASPSPANATSTSQDSFDFPDDPTLLALLGGDPAQDMRDILEDQKEQERALTARRLQERADEEYARQLQEQGATRDPFQDFSRHESSAVPEGASKNTLDSQGRVSRPTPYAWSSSPATVKEENIPPPSLGFAPESSHPDTYGSIKNERSYEPDQHIRDLSSDFIDLEGDEFDFNDYQPYTANGHPSSDPVEIGSTAFDRNNQQSRDLSLSSVPMRDNAYGDIDYAGVPGWGFPGGQLGQSLANSASNLWSGAYNGAYNLLDSQIATYGTPVSGFGGSSVYGSNTVGSSADIIDLDSYDEPTYLPQDILKRHGINAHDPANKDLVASYMDRVDYVANDPTRTTEEIKSLLENIRPDEELPPENREGTPEAMTYPLMEHQKLGLAWLKSMEEGSNKGGILADAMGLGKTIQALALMVARKSDDRACKTTLIVCPVALLRQWESEISSKLKASHALKVYTLHGDKRHIEWSKLRTYDVVLTTFGTLGTEVKRREGIE